MSEDILTGRSPTAKDIEYADVKGKHQLKMLIAKIVGLPFAIASFALPVWALNAFAGTLTEVKVDIAVGITVALSGFSALVTHMAHRWKGRTQGDELIRLRERCTLLEKQLENARDEMEQSRNKMSETERRIGVLEGKIGKEAKR